MLDRVILSVLAMVAALSSGVRPPGACELSTTLCAQNGRFEVTVDWQSAPLGPSRAAHAIPVTDDSGYFWFFDPQNVELMVKVLDGRPVNGAYWVFIGPLTNRAYRVTVRDTLTTAVRTYDNAWGEMASVADTKAFPSAGGVSAPVSEPRRTATNGPWSSIGPADSYPWPVYSVAADPHDARIVYAAYEHGDEGAVARSVDGGVTWTDELRHLDMLGPVLVDPANPNQVYFGGAGGGVWRSQDGGTTWTAAPTGPEVYALASSGGALYAGTWNGISVSTDQAESWTDLPLPGADDENPVVTAIAVDPQNPQALYAGTGGGYLWKTVDGGASWALVWSERSHGITSIQTDPFDGRMIHVGTTYTGPAPMHMPILSPYLRSSDGGQNWTESFLPEGGFDALVVDAAHPGVLYAGSDGGVFRSVDHGETWTGIGEIGRVWSLSLSGSSLYAASYDGAFWRDVAALPGACSSDPHTLCLGDGRFRVAAGWQVSPDGPTVQASPIPLTRDTGAFWFFHPSNVELVVKVLDGRPVNGHFWVFVGGLSSIHYLIEVTDTETGQVWTHEHAPGEPESFADTSVF